MTPAEIQEFVAAFVALEPQAQKGIAWIVHKLHAHKVAEEAAKPVSQAKPTGPVA